MQMNAFNKYCLFVQTAQKQVELKCLSFSFILSFSSRQGNKIINKRQVWCKELSHFEKSYIRTRREKGGRKSLKLSSQNCQKAFSKNVGEKNVGCIGRKGPCMDACGRRGAPLQSISWFSVMFFSCRRALRRESSLPSSCHPCPFLSFHSSFHWHHLLRRSF